MAPVAATALFIVSLAVTLASARSFAARLDRLGWRFGLPEALIGLLTALAADGPEISAALFALLKGEHGVSVGVLVGSNAFNLAAMIGVSGLLAGSVCLSRGTLLLEGLVVAALTLIGGAVLLGWLAPVVAAILAACVLLPYLLLLIGGSELVARHRDAEHLLGVLARILEQRPQSAPPPGALSSEGPAHRLLGLMVLDVVLIVAGSAGMVQSALTLGQRWGVSKAILGMLILAPLTSLPNAITGVRLGLAGRGGALVGETFNSNTINLAVGVIVPSLFVTLAALTSTATLQLGWLIGMTGVCLLMLMPRRGMRRAHAAILVALYGGFVAMQLA